MSEVVRLYEVSLRDGLQNEPDIVDIDDKLVLLERLLATGLTDIEITSFVRPRFIPQLADAAEFVRRLPPHDGVRFWALVPNRVGLDRAVDAGIDHIATFLSASESHNKANVNRTVAESLAGLTEVVGSAVGQGMRVRSYISTVFGCPFEGPVPVGKTIELAHALLDAGAVEVSLGDTIGSASPTLVRRTLHTMQDAGVPIERIAAHFHDTRGTAIANAFAAFELGVRTFDGSVGGVGGCPYAPGAAGNLATEELAYLFLREGHRTGVNLEKLCAATDFLEAVLGRELPGRYHRWANAGGVEPGSKVRSA